MRTDLLRKMVLGGFQDEISKVERLTHYFGTQRVGKGVSENTSFSEDKGSRIKGDGSPPSPSPYFQPFLDLRLKPPFSDLLGNLFSLLISFEIGRGVAH